ncbi:MAG: YciI family protein [Myxococcota bacterium]
MSKFMYIFRGGRDPDITPAALGVHLAHWSAWLAELTAAGRIAAVGGALLESGRTLRGTAKAATDGPYAEAKDLVTGTITVIAESLDEATELARGCPVFHYDGSVEVRPTAPPIAG